MQIENPPIVNSIDDYVETSVDIANKNPSEMLELKKYFQKQANTHLFENINFLHEINHIFKNL